jgi:hypothetical protein
MIQSERGMTFCLCLNFFPAGTTVPTLKVKFVAGAAGLEKVGELGDSTG